MNGVEVRLGSLRQVLVLARVFRARVFQARVFQARVFQARASQARALQARLTSCPPHIYIA